ncbi:NUDIX hydrolase [Pantoea sp. A4]|uniref:NUDIX hydrolase n=1 Tax=Pantoea sp. A4 TaxID=1225184 RepID=UPI0003603E6C|nr:NUDIX domain-containing protein [Pantoea sp. A4]
MSADKQIHIAAAIITDTAGRCLLVRKQNTTHFMQPGGKIDTGETATAALVRELAEELAVSITSDDLFYLGKFSDSAINEPGCEVIAEIYHLRTDKKDFVPAAEIAEVMWYPADDGRQVPLAPLTENHLLPLIPQLTQ